MGLTMLFLDRVMIPPPWGSVVVVGGEVVGGCGSNVGCMEEGGSLLVVSLLGVFEDEDWDVVGEDMPDGEGGSTSEVSGEVGLVLAIGGAMVGKTGSWRGPVCEVVDVVGWATSARKGNSVSTNLTWREV
jgi:hypothetical protein